MTSNNQVKEVTIRQSASRWSADLHWTDGSVWVGWQAKFRSKAAMIDSIRCTCDAPVVEL